MTELTFELAVAARPETVFAYFTDPERFARWMGPGASLGSHGFRVAYPGGNVVVGEVVEADSPHRVVLTWGYEAGEPALPAGATRIEIRLEPHERRHAAPFPPDRVPRRGGARGAPHRLPPPPRGAVSERGV